MKDASGQARTHTVTWTDPAELHDRRKAMSGLEAMQAIVTGDLARAPAGALVGWEHREAASGRAVLVLTPAPYHFNHYQGVHGGILACLIEATFGAAVSTVLPAGSLAATVDLHATFVRAVRLDTGELRCEAEVVHLGKRVITAQARVTDAQGRLYAHAVTTHTRVS